MRKSFRFLVLLLPCCNAAVAQQKTPLPVINLFDHTQWFGTIDYTANIRESYGEISFAPNGEGGFDTSALRIVQYRNGRLAQSEVYDYVYQGGNWSWGDAQKARQYGSCLIHEGTLSRYTYDAKGNLVREVAYSVIPSNSYGLINSYVKGWAWRGLAGVDDPKTAQKLMDRYVDSLRQHPPPDYSQRTDSTVSTYNTAGYPELRHSYGHQRDTIYAYDYDASGRAIKQSIRHFSTARNDSPRFETIHRFSYDSMGKITDIRSEIVSYDTIRKVNPMYRTSPRDQILHYHYNSFGLPDTFINQQYEQSTFYLTAYNEAHQPISVLVRSAINQLNAHDTGRFTRLEYNKQGLLQKVEGFFYHANEKYYFRHELRHDTAGKLTEILEYSWTSRTAGNLKPVRKRVFVYGLPDKKVGSTIHWHRAASYGALAIAAVVSVGYVWSAKRKGR